MISAIIFDCFGVLTSDAWLPFKNKHFGDDRELFQQASDISKQSDAGYITYQDFLAGVADLSGMPFEDVEQAIENNVPNEPLFAVIRELKPKYKIGFLSNASAHLLDELFSAEQVTLFDAVSLSYETGFAKPDERAYDNIAERLGVLPEECVFIDDMERNCTAAREAGMQAVWYQDFEQTKTDLLDLLSQSEK